MISDRSFMDIDERGRTSTLLEDYMKIKLPVPIRVLNRTVSIEKHGFLYWNMAEYE